MTKQVQLIASYAIIVGTVIVRYRQKRGLTQAVFAERVGVAASTWSRVENGHQVLSIAQLSRAAEVLSLDPWQVLASADGVRSEAVKRGIRVVHECKSSEFKLSEGFSIVQADALLDLVKEVETSL